MERVDGDELVAEIVRMLGGDGGDEAADRHARELLRPPDRVAGIVSAAMAIATATAIRGTARLGRRTKDLVKRLGPDDVAVIDHRNLDRIAAEELAACGVRAAINASPSSDGSYPNAGPLTLVRAGIPLIDAGPDALRAARRRGRREIEDGRISSGGRLVAEGRRLRPDQLARDLDAQRARIDRALHDFTENTMAHLREEAGLLSGTIDLPETRSRFRDRHVLIVVRGTDHVRDLRALRAYIAETNPVLVGVDGGADAIVSEGLMPDLILGDMDSAGERTLRCGAELVVHAYPDGEAPGPSGSAGWRCRTPWCRLRGRARTSRCCSPTRRGPR